MQNYLEPHRLGYLYSLGCLQMRWLFQTALPDVQIIHTWCKRLTYVHHPPQSYEDFMPLAQPASYIFSPLVIRSEFLSSVERNTYFSLMFHLYRGSRCKTAAPPVVSLRTNMVLQMGWMNAGQSLSSHFPQAIPS